MPRPVNIGLLNVSMKIVSLAERRQWLLEQIDAAGKDRCQFVVLPEFADHHRTHEALAAHGSGPDEVRKVCALGLDDPFMRECAALARKHRMVVIPDVFFKDGGTYSNSTVVFGPEGGVLGKYSKTHVAPGEAKFFDPGHSIEPIATPFGKIGLLICYDINFHELTRCHELKGAELLIWTTMRQGEHEYGQVHALLPARAIEHSLPFAVATYVTEHQMVGRKPLSSMCFNALGQAVAGGQVNAGLVRATVDLDDKVLSQRYWGKSDWIDEASYLRRQRRPDLYGELVKPIPPGERDIEKEPTVRKVEDYNPSL